MAQSFRIILIVLFVCNNCFAQQNELKLLSGKVLADSKDLEGIYVFNASTKNAVLTDKMGFFKIPAKIGDTLMISSVQLKGVQVVVQKEDFGPNLFFVKMQVMMRQLDDVVITQYKNINPISLGIVSKNVKTYTPAERKVYTATNGVDKLFNMFSGRTKMLKGEVEIEKKEFMLEKISRLYEDSYFIDKLKIPQINIKGFQYYIIEDKEFVEALNSKNKTLATFLMGQLAVDYLELLNQK